MKGIISFPSDIHYVKCKYCGYTFMLLAIQETKDDSGNITLGYMFQTINILCPHCGKKCGENEK